MSAFDAAAFLPERVLALITEARVQDPERALRAAEKRVRRAGSILSAAEACASISERLWSICQYG